MLYINNLLKLFLAVLVAFFLAGVQFEAPSRAAPAAPNSLDPVSQATILAAYGQLPLSFEANRGQTDGQVKFLARGSGYTLFLTPAEAVLALHRPAVAEKQHPLDLEATLAQTEQAQVSGPAVLRMRLVGANLAPRMVGLEKLPGQANYFLGNEPARWRTHVPAYAKVAYRAVYPGVDLVYYGNQHQLEYDFIVAPGADPARIRLAFGGAQKLEVDGQGELVVDIAGEQVRLRRPVVYQERNGLRQEIAGAYTLLPRAKTEGRGEGLPQVGFRVGAYDPGRPLIIDPVLVYSTYLGGSADDSVIVRGLTVDASDNAYIAGVTRSPDFPTLNAVQPTYGGSGDLFVTKLDATGMLVYSTYFGGSGTDSGTGIGEVDLVTVDMSGNAYIAGVTLSPDFPTQNAVQASFGGSDDHFMTKLDATGLLVYSTYLGGSNSDGTVQGFTVDASENAYIVGVTSSTNFPTANAVQAGFAGIRDVAVTKLNAAGGFVYSTYLGGNSFESINDFMVDGSGNAYVLGSTRSANFPTANAGQPLFGGLEDAFVTKFNPTGGFVYSTFLGGSSLDLDGDLALDMSGNIYIEGLTASANFPTRNPVQATFGGGTDVFVTKLDGTGLLIYSTYLGGSGSDRDSHLAVDASGNAYAVGDTTSTNFPTQNAGQPTSGGSHDAFATKLDGAGALVYSTYLGGSGGEFFPKLAVDGNGNAYVVGDTPSADFPTLNAMQPGFGGNQDTFVAKLNATGGFVYSTYLGGSNLESIENFDVDVNGNAYVVGLTTSPNFPTMHAIQASFGGAGDVFVTKLDDVGGFIYSSYLGGSSSDRANDLAVDTGGSIYILGQTGSPNFPTVNAVQPTFGGPGDAFMVKIADDRPPTANAGGPYNGDEGSPISLDGSASGDDNGIALYEWDCEDNGIFDLTSTFPTGSTCTYPDNSGLMLRLRVTDTVGQTAEATAGVTVNNVAPLIDAGADAALNEGDTFSNSGSFTDPGADTWTALVDYGDGSGVQPLILNPDQSFSLSHTYADNGAFTVAVIVTDDDSEVGTDAVQVTVNNVAPVVDAGPDATINAGSTFSSAGTFADPGADSWTATVDYGDGSGSQSLSLNLDQSFSLNHTYATAGIYNVTVTITDDEGVPGFDTVMVTLLTPQQVIAVISNEVKTLVNTGVLNQGQGNALIVKLEAALKKLDQGNANAAINQLQAFINQVNALMNAGVLSPAEGQPLIDAANGVIASIIAGQSG